MDLVELRTYWQEPGALLEDMTFFPVCLSWPMGFSWSSYIAQSYLLSLCRRAGLDEHRMLADDLDVPVGKEVMYWAGHGRSYALLDRSQSERDEMAQVI